MFKMFRIGMFLFKLAESCSKFWFFKSIIVFGAKFKAREWKFGGLDVLTLVAPVVELINYRDLVFNDSKSFLNAEEGYWFVGLTLDLLDATVLGLKLLIGGWYFRISPGVFILFDARLTLRLSNIWTGGCSCIIMLLWGY